MKLSFRTWLIIIGVALVAIVVVGVVWGEGPAAWLLAALGGGGGTLTYAQKRKLLNNAESAREGAEDARVEAEAAAAEHAASAERARAFVDEVDKDIAAAPARDAAADAAARATAEAAGQAVLDGGDEDDDLLIAGSSVASRIRDGEGEG